MEICTQMNRYTVYCLILACGNTLRSDDGVGPWLAEWADKHFRDESGVRVVSAHQWTPEFAEDIAGARFVIFVDCSIATPAGSIEITPVAASTKTAANFHHLAPAELLALAQALFDSLPLDAMLLTVGAGSIELGESFSSDVNAALPNASALLEETVRKLLVNAQDPQWR
jgi:hydrogenase maturation protease